jgi:hypothetical protein
MSRPAEAVEAALHRARVARREGRGASVLDALADAATSLAALEDPEHPLPVVVAWKAAKAEHDFGERAAVVRHLDPVCERDDLFSAWPAGLVGAEQLARAHQDAIGYGDPTVCALWERLSRFHRAHGDRYRAARADLELAWDAACRGRPTGPYLERVLALRVADLQGGPSWHPDAPDAAGSLPWLLLDAAHTALRAAIWSGARDEAHHALDELRHAIEELPRRPDDYVWSALAEAAHDGVGEPVSPPALHGFHGAWTHALRTGDGFDVALAQAPGPEWALAVRLARVRTEREPHSALEDAARAAGCLAFLRPR